MGTAWAEIITDYAMVEISDTRLSEELKESPALFFRRMDLYMRNAVPYFSSPPEMQSWLSYTAPQYADYSWTGETSSQETVLDTGLIGYELMSVQKIHCDATGNVMWEAYHEAVYNSETGTVTFPAGINAGTEFQIDFYTDGSFDNTLTGEEKRILGLCVALVWNERFTGDWLNRQPKIHDKSFSVGSESAYTRAETERMRTVRAALNDELRRYEQNLAYRELAAEGALTRYRRL